MFNARRLEAAWERGVRGGARSIAASRSYPPVPAVPKMKGAMRVSRDGATC